VKTKIIRDADFERIAEGVKPDAKKRVVLSGAELREGVTYHVYVNSLGQIVLDPQVTIPASEAWLFQNPEALEAVRRGLADAAGGRTSKVDLNEL
jgi:ABC-type nitrate/sulfonate/bicarbonate transport system substrate-binding protein